MNKHTDDLDGHETERTGNDVRVETRRSSKGQSHMSVHYGVFVLVLIIILAGALTKTIFTASLIALILSYGALLVLRYPGRRASFAIAFAPVALAPLVLVAGGFATQIDHDKTRSDKATLIENSELVSKDAQKFLDNYRAGNVWSRQGMEKHALLQLGANDWLGHQATDMLIKLVGLSDAGEVDTAALRSSAQMFSADHAIILQDPTITDRYTDQIISALELHPDTPIVDLPEEVLSQAVPDYRGMSVIYCWLRSDGELLLVSGAPAGIYTDLRTVPAAEGFVEACRLVAQDRPMTEQASLGQQ